MKKLCYSAFVAFWASIATLLALQVLATDSGSASAPAREEAAAGATYSLDEVGRHTTPDDCWFAIEGAVYDVTDYIPQHPTPPSVLHNWCGKEATEGMRTKGYGRDHSPAAWEQLEDYRIGDLEQGGS